jgi:uncharacterized protein DUF732
VRRLGALAALTLLLATAACAEATRTTATPVASAVTTLDPVPENTTTPTQAAPPRPRHTSPAPSPAPSPAGDAGSGNAGLDRFVAAVRRDLPEVALDRRDEEVEALGEQACAGLRSGKTGAVVAGEIGAEDVAPADARELVTLARSTACPGRPKVADPA